MPQVKPSEYNVAFANYVLDINRAASEIFRILKPGGIFVTSIPNPTAPEFIISRLTPLWFHKIIRGREAWETYYSYKNIEKLGEIFNKAGFETIDVLYWSFSQGYVNRFPVINKLSRFYDKLINFLRLKRFMNNVCIVFTKPLQVRISNQQRNNNGKQVFILARVIFYGQERRFLKLGQVLI